MLRFVLLNLILASAYLWGAENNRYICAALWVVAPLANILVLAIKEAFE